VYISLTFSSTTSLQSLLTPPRLVCLVYNLCRLQHCMCAYKYACDLHCARAHVDALIVCPLLYQTQGPLHVTAWWEHSQMAHGSLSLLHSFSASAQPWWQVRLLCSMMCLLADCCYGEEDQMDKDTCSAWYTTALSDCCCVTAAGVSYIVCILSRVHVQ
jgi:hypothetical protein